MNVLLEALKNPGSMNAQQWLLVCIMLFVVVGSLYFVFRLYRIIENERKSSYVPNIGRRRLSQEADEDKPAGAEKSGGQGEGSKSRETD